MTSRASASDATSGHAAGPGPAIRAFRLLRYIAEGGATGNLSEVARRIDVNRVTVMRLLDTLEQEGLIERTAPGTHRVGMAFLTLAASALGSHDLVSMARRVMPGLSAATQLSCYLCVREHTEVVYVLREMAQTPLVSNIRVGTRLPAYRATPGRMLLADLDAAALAALYAPPALTPAAFDAVRATLAQDRARGSAWSHSGLEAGVDACAVGIRDASGLTIAALSVAGPESRFAADASLRERVEQALHEAAGTLSRALGWRDAGAAPAHAQR